MWRVIMYLASQANDTMRPMAYDFPLKSPLSLNLTEDGTEFFAGTVERAATTVNQTGEGRRAERNFRFRKTRAEKVSGRRKHRPA